MTNPSLLDFSNALADAAARAGRWTVLVDARHRIPASGIALKPNQVLTANHAVERDDDITILLPDGSRQSATVAGRDAGSDLALLRLEQATAVPAEFAGAAPRVGQIVLALARPTPEGVQASLGVISATGGPVRTGRGTRLERYYRTDAQPLPGFSGGPLIDAAGQVLGLNTSGFGTDTIITVPARVAQQIAEALAQYGRILRGHLGIRSQVVELPATVQQALGREQASGLLLVGLESDSPALQAGLMVGDILVGMADQAIGDHEDLLAYLYGDVAGKEAPATILRGGQPVTRTVTIGSH
ncbi:MAG: S1C family serine protease [Chloroflexota bacterium]